MSQAFLPMGSIHIIDDNTTHRSLLRRLLQSAEGLDLPIFEHSSGVDLFEHLDSARQGCIVLLDEFLVGERGHDLLPRVVARNMGPVILLTADGNEEIATQSMRAGASDYLVKERILDDPELLHQSIRSGVERFKLREKNLAYEHELVAKNRRLAELYEMANAFVDNVTHEFRTPLAVLQEFLSLFLDGLAGPIDATQRSYLKLMAGKVSDLTLMVDDLLDAGRLESGLLSPSRIPCTIYGILDSVRSELSKRAIAGNVKLVVECPAGLPDVYCAPDLIGRVLNKLVMNAINFSPQDGEVAVKVTASGSDKNQLEILVVDEGPGIPEDSVDGIFEMFKQAGNCRASGTGLGLGLTIARDLMRLNLGTLAVRSSAGSGSTFAFTVPKYDPRYLIRTFLAKLGQLGSESRAVSLISVLIEHPDTARRQEAADLVNRTLRPYDLFLPTADTCHWLILAATHEAQQMMERLRRESGALYSEKTSVQIPRIGFHALGDWLADAKGQPLIIERCLRELECAAPVEAATVDAA